MTSVRQDIGAYLKRLRDTHDPPLTQGQAADKIGVSTRRYGNWERSISEPRLQNIIRIAETFGIEAHELIEASDVADTAGQRLATIEAMLAEVLERLDEHGLTLPTPSEVAETAAQRRDAKPAATARAPRGRRRTTQAG